MAAFNKFNSFIAAVHNKVHNLASDQIMVALSTVAPTAANAILTDITEISYANLSSRVVSTTSSTQTSGTYKLVLADLTLTASGAVAAFRYVTLYNNTATNKELIGWYDRGSTVTLGVSGDTCLIDLDQAAGTISAV